MIKPKQKPDPLKLYYNLYMGDTKEIKQKTKTSRFMKKYS